MRNLFRAAFVLVALQLPAFAETPAPKTPTAVKAKTTKKPTKKATAKTAKTTKKADAKTDTKSDDKATEKTTDDAK